jgi:DNA repair protein RadC
MQWSNSIAIIRRYGGAFASYFNQFNSVAGSEKLKVTSSQIAAHLFRAKIRLDTEEFWVLALNSQLKVLGLEMLFRGTVDSCPIHIRDIIRFVCVRNASFFMVAHSHPSGDHGPSRQDLNVTRRIRKLSELLEIPILDHLILSNNGYSSLADRGFFRNKSDVILNRIPQDF